MDLLSSILGSMDRPPSKQQKGTNMYEKQRKEYECVKNRQREELNRFRTYVEERLGRFMKDENRHNLEFQSMDKVHRSIVHDVSETAGLSGMSFGMEGERYIVVYKKEHLPCEDELNARKNGEVWNEETAAQYAEKRRLKHLKQSGDTNDLHITRAEKLTPVSSCTKKYMQLFSEEVKMENVRKTEINASYGYVPSANKKDVRSIEQTMADILTKKRLKTHHKEPEEGPYSTEVSSQASRHIPGATDKA
ncbi:sperm-associated antigen 7-like [Anopheles arabiensis]|uniref:sperm-associated antigen 7-like n=1 Tax=Anopheles arabiensis TaxID=7173 RepID=UPI001AAC5619|nr:sperm-associated antigen 7-like [Anopheles arabiensis]XP_040175172.1 sperm-associated antigen 7-like [Anopheles arabiensis]